MDGARLRILLCTAGGLSGALVTRRLIASPRVQLCGLVLSTRTLHARQGFMAGALEHARRSGIAYATYLWSATSLGDLALCLSSPGPAAAQARRAGAPVLGTPLLDARRAFVEACRPDLLVTAFFNQRVGAEVAAVPRLGAVNIHPSVLPDQRGVDPVFRARLAGASSLGVTVHRLAPDFDSGPVLRSERVPDDRSESVLLATARLYERGARMLLDALGDLEAGAAGTAQPPGGSYDSWPGRAEVREAARRGVRLARASDLWPGSRIVESGRTAAP